MSSRVRNAPKGALQLAAVRALRDVPTLSVILQEVLHELDERRSSFDRLVQIVGRDQVLAAKVLRTVNSAYFAREAPVGDLKKALHFLGDHTLRAIVVGSQSFKPDDLLLAPDFDVLEFWRYCFATAVACELLAREKEAGAPGEFFTAGLLHDLGKLVHMRIDRDGFVAALRLAREREQSLLWAELELGGAGHSVLAEALGEAWKLPVFVRKLGRYYARDVSAMSTLPCEIKPKLMLSSIAIAAIRTEGVGSWGEALPCQVPRVYWESTGIRASQATEAAKRAAERRRS